MVVLDIRRVLNEYRELKKQVQNKEISLEEFYELCKEKYSAVDSEIFKKAA